MVGRWSIPPSSPPRRCDSGSRSHRRPPSRANHESAGRSYHIPCSRRHSRARTRQTRPLMDEWQLETNQSRFRTRETRPTTRHSRTPSGDARSDAGHARMRRPDFRTRSLRSRLPSARAQPCNARSRRKTHSSRAATRPLWPVKHRTRAERSSGRRPMQSSGRMSSPRPARSGRPHAGSVSSRARRSSSSRASASIPSVTYLAPWRSGRQQTRSRWAPTGHEVTHLVSVQPRLRTLQLPMRRARK